jgi:predicted membrane chloride channel (bestrophin family)
VIWHIWPAVVFQTIFAAVVVALDLKGIVKLEIPNVMLNVLGVVIGFVISYRAMSGYDRYWQGRSAWTNVIQESRTLGRLIWYHVPTRLTPRTADEISTGVMNRTSTELMKVMAEKRMALDLILGFAVAMKHHLRGELGIYYEDLYHLVRPLHEHDHTPEQKRAVMNSSLQPPPSRARRIASNPSLPQARGISGESSPPKKHQRVHYHTEHDNASEGTFYGTFPVSESPRGSLHRVPSNASIHSQHQALAPAQQPAEPDSIMRDVDTELIPFSGFFGRIRRLFSRKSSYSVLPTQDPTKNPFGPDSSQRMWSGPIQPRIGSEKHTVSTTARGENLPLEILRCMSEWCSVLEERNTVPGTSLGSMIGTIAALEATLSSLEQILTTPLPFVYSVHIRHTVWVYLFFLPFQLVAEFKWHAVPGVALAAFIYLGFLSAGEEIEQPFGYDENDLDLDMFCKEIIEVDITNLKKSPCLNSYLPPTPRLARHRSMTLAEAIEIDSETEY